MILNAALALLFYVCGHGFLFESSSMGNPQYALKYCTKLLGHSVYMRFECMNMRVFENRVLRRIFGPKRDDVTGDWRKLHNDELHNLYSSPNIIRIIKSRRSKLAGQLARMGETKNAYRILVGKPERKRPLGRPRSMWVENIKMGLREIGWDGMDWIELAQDRDQWRALVNTVRNLRFS
jgi:hypothetical protein